MAQHDGLKSSGNPPKRKAATHNERLEQAIVFLSEEDAHLRLAFDQELATIEREILIKFPLQQADYDPKLYEQVRAMVAVHKRRAASLTADAGHTPAQTPMPFGAALRKRAGRHHEAHPPFRLENSAESYEFVKQFKSDTPRGRQLRTIDHQAFNAALEYPASIKEPIQVQGSMENRAKQRGTRRAALQMTLQAVTPTTVAESEGGSPVRDILTSSCPGEITEQTAGSSNQLETARALKEFEDLSKESFDLIYLRGLSDIIPAWLTGREILTPEGNTLRYLFFLAEGPAEERVQLPENPDVTEMEYVISLHDGLCYPYERAAFTSPLCRANKMLTLSGPTMITLEKTRKTLKLQVDHMLSRLRLMGVWDGRLLSKPTKPLDAAQSRELLRLQTWPFASSPGRKTAFIEAQESATALWGYLRRRYNREIERTLVNVTHANETPEESQSSRYNLRFNAGGEPRGVGSNNAAVSSKQNNAANNGAADSGAGPSGSGNGNGNSPPRNNRPTNGGDKGPNDGKLNNGGPPNTPQLSLSRRIARRNKSPRVAEWGEIWHADFPPLFLFGETEYMKNVMSRQVGWDLKKGSSYPSPCACPFSSASLPFPHPLHPTFSVSFVHPTPPAPTTSWASSRLTNLDCRSRSSKTAAPRALPVKPLRRPALGLLCHARAAGLRAHGAACVEVPPAGHRYAAQCLGPDGEGDIEGGCAGSGRSGGGEGGVGTEGARGEGGGDVGEGEGEEEGCGGGSGG